MPTKAPDGSLIETRAERKRRLVKYGVWEEYQEKRKQYVAKGFTKSKVEDLLTEDFSSANLARRDVGSKQTKLDETQTEQLASDPQNTLEAYYADMSPPTELDCRWVYHHYADRDADEEQAPSKGAWGLLLAARDSQKVYELVIDRVTPKQFKFEEDIDNTELLNLTGLTDQIVKEWGVVKAGLLA